jgi:hypothetical protein
MPSSSQLNKEYADLQGITYLGDAVYASWDGFQIKLKTGDGNDQVIYLDYEVQSNLIAYIRRIRNYCHAVYGGETEDS